MFRRGMELDKKEGELEQMWGARTEEEGGEG